MPAVTCIPTHLNTRHTQSWPLHTLGAPRPLLPHPWVWLPGPAPTAPPAPSDTLTPPSPPHPHLLSLHPWVWLPGPANTAPPAPSNTPTPPSPPHPHLLSLHPWVWLPGSASTAATSRSCRSHSCRVGRRWAGVGREGRGGGGWGWGWVSSLLRRGKAERPPTPEALQGLPASCDPVSCFPPCPPPLAFWSGEHPWRTSSRRPARS